MIIYNKSLAEFNDDVLNNVAADLLVDTLREHHIGCSESQIGAFQNSLNFMRNVLDTDKISRECRAAIEYTIPQTSKRIDFMILGSNEQEEDHAVIIELKQWSHVSKIDDVFRHSVYSDLAGGRIPTNHPSYQAFSYKKLMANYCSGDYVKENMLHPCAYLHNMPETYREVLEDDIYQDWVEEAPVFLKQDVLKLREFIEKYVSKKSADDKLLYNIDFGRIKPTKALQDSIDSMLCGNEEFMMIDEQAIAYDFIMSSIRKAQGDNKKHVLIIEGGPGTGKSVLAINALAECITKLQLNAAYITKNRAPRNCYKKLLARGKAKEMVDMDLAIMSPFGLPNTPENQIDVGFFDEAHRMQKRPYQYPGTDMLADGILACRVSVFFVDEDQRIAVRDCYDVDRITEYANNAGAVIETEEPFQLTSQFRCNGSDGYLAFLDDLLEIRETANNEFDFSNYDFRVYSSPQELKDALKEVDQGRNKSRMCAGYCYDWNVKNHRGEWDVIIGDFKAKWNLPNDQTFAISPNSFNEIGCIHTVQGMEFDYVGVIIGKDLLYYNGKVCTDKTAISRDDGSSGIRTCKDPRLADRLIRNTYKVLLTRGQKGCFVFCEDPALAEHIKSRIGGGKEHEDK